MLMMNGRKLVPPRSEDKIERYFQLLRLKEMPVQLSISRKRLRNTKLKWRKEQKVDRPEGESSLFCYSL